MKISGIIITKNEEDSITGAIESIRPVCDEIIVVDSGSTDKTVALAQEMNARVVVHTWEGYKEQRQFADTLTTNDWVLTLDADERLSNRLRKAISSLKGQEIPESVNAFAFRRNLYFMGKCFRNNRVTCEWKTRLYRKSCMKWTGGSVHESVRASGRIRRIHETINHYPYENIEECLDKLQTYALLKAADKLDKDKPAGFWTILFNIKFNFFKKYILELKFLKGTPGFILAWMETNYSATKYMKLYELQNSQLEEEAGHHE